MVFYILKTKNKGFKKGIANRETFVGELFIQWQRQQQQQHQQRQQHQI